MLGYFQYCDIIEASGDICMAIGTKEINCIYLRLDISARDANTGKKLNRRFLPVRVVNKKLIKFIRAQRLPVTAEIRLYASGFHTKEESSTYKSIIDVYEIRILDDYENT